MRFANPADGNVNLHGYAESGEGFPFWYVYNGLVYSSARDAVNGGTVIGTNCKAFCVYGDFRFRTTVEVPVSCSRNNRKDSFWQSWEAFGHFVLHLNENLFGQVVKCNFRSIIILQLVRVFFSKLHAHHGAQTTSVQSILFVM